MLKFKELLLIFVSCHYFIRCYSDDSRYLVYTSGGGVFKFIIGFGIPVQVPMSVIFAHNFQFQYYAIDNASEYQYLIQNGILRHLKFTRHDVYHNLYDFLYKYDYGDCLLKTICELSETPLENNGILSEVLNIIFRPELKTMNQFSEAWFEGQNGTGCSGFYCPPGHGFLDRFSTVHHEPFSLEDPDFH